MNDAEKKKWLDGYECGLTWPDSHDYRPGGPWIYMASRRDQPEQIDMEIQSRLENAAWRSGWEVGFVCGKSTGIRFTQAQIDAIWVKHDRELQVVQIRTTIQKLTNSYNELVARAGEMPKLDACGPYRYMAQLLLTEAAGKLKEAINQLNISIK